MNFYELLRREDPSYLSEEAMARQIHNFDWSQTKIGSSQSWPKTLHTTLFTVLKSKLPMLLLWGEEGLCFYNDAYCPFLEEVDKFKGVLGQPGAALGTQIWSAIKPTVNGVLTDGETRCNHQSVYLRRSGKPEACQWTLLYSPVLADGDSVAGVLITYVEAHIQPSGQGSANETKPDSDAETIKGKPEDFVSKEVNGDDDQRYRQLLLQSPFAVAIFQGKDMVVTLANDSIKQVWGKGRDVEGKSVFTVLPELDTQIFPRLLKNVYTTGEPYIGSEVLLKLVRNGIPEDTYFNFVYQPYRDVDGTISGVTLIAHEVTAEVSARKKMELSENYFRQLTDTVPAIIWITKPDGTCTYLNQHWYDYTGQTEKEAEGFGWLNAAHPDDKREASRAFIDANAAQKPFNALYRLRTASGDYRWAIDSGRPKFGVNGTFEGMIGTVVDVHEEKMAEELLRYRKALLEAHIEANLDGILLVDAKGKIISYNQRFIEIWNMPPEIVTAQDDVAALDFAMSQLVNPQQFIDRVNYLYLHPTETSIDELEYLDGKIIERHGYPVVGEDGTYYAWSWTFRDVTTQKVYERAIKESEENFRQLADLVPHIVWTARADGYIDYYNQRWYDYTGFEKNYGDESWIPLLHPDDVKTCLDTWYDSVKTGKPYQIEYRFKDRENGGYRWFLGKALPVRNEDGIITKWFGTGTDIHDQKAIEEKLETLVNIRTTELKRSNEDLQQFAHVASHDLKEPVRKLKTFSSRLNDEFGAALPEKAKMYIDKMEKAANRMYAMIDGVLLYSSINVVDQIMDVVDLNKLLRQVEDDLEVVIHQKKAIIIYRNLPSIEGSEILLYQLFYNLVNNALKFSKEGFAPVVSIDCKTIYKQKEQHAEITVQDNGIGFDQAFAERIFKTFTRLNSKDLYEGTGLGLSLCKKIVERHGGAINARGKENEGAVFTIMLPVKQTSISIEI